MKSEVPPEPGRTAKQREPIDTDPITLKEACVLVFRNRVGVSALRSEAERGTLTIFRIGGRDFTTLREVWAMVEKCRIGGSRCDSTPIQTQSIAAHDSAALAAIDEAMRNLRVTKR